MQLVLLEAVLHTSCVITEASERMLTSVDRCVPASVWLLFTRKK